MADLRLIAGVGYPDLGDLSFGPILVERLRQRRPAACALVEDLSYNALAVVEWLRDQAGRFAEGAFVTAVERGREPGSLTSVEWTETSAPAEVVQDRIAEAVTGTISLENLLIIGRHFDVLPPRVIVHELEPVASHWGTGLSTLASERAERLISDLVQLPAVVAAANGKGGQAVTR